MSGTLVGRALRRNSLRILQDFLVIKWDSLQSLEMLAVPFSFDRMTRGAEKEITMRRYPLFILAGGAIGLFLAFLLVSDQKLLVAAPAQQTLPCKAFQETGKSVCG